MNILGIKLKSKTNANVFVVETDVGNYNFHSDIIVKCNIKVGDVDEKQFFLAVQESEELIAMGVAMKYVASNLKTEKQIKDYLYKKEFSKQTIDVVIEKLKEYKVIDDKVYAETYLKSNPNFSKRKVQQKLSSFGVKRDLAEEITNEVDDLTSCQINANKFLKNKTLNKETVEKLIRRLTYMGYRWDTIKGVLNNLKFEYEEE